MMKIKQLLFGKAITANAKITKTTKTQPDRSSSSSSSSSSDPSHTTRTNQSNLNNINNIYIENNRSSWQQPDTGKIPDGEIIWVPFKTRQLGHDDLIRPANGEPAFDGVCCARKAKIKTNPWLCLTPLLSGDNPVCEISRDLRCYSVDASPACDARVFADAERSWRNAPAVPARPKRHGSRNGSRHGSRNGFRKSQSGAEDRQAGKVASDAIRHSNCDADTRWREARFCVVKDGHASAESRGSSRFADEKRTEVALICDRRNSSSGTHPRNEVAETVPNSADLASEGYSSIGSLSSEIAYSRSDAELTLPPSEADLTRGVYSTGSSERLMPCKERDLDDSGCWVFSGCSGEPCAEGGRENTKTAALDDDLSEDIYREAIENDSSDYKYGETLENDRRESKYNKGVREIRETLLEQTSSLKKNLINQKRMNDVSLKVFRKYTKGKAAETDLDSRDKTSNISVDDISDKVSLRNNLAECRNAFQLEQDDRNMDHTVKREMSSSVNSGGANRAGVGLRIVELKRGISNDSCFNKLYDNNSNFICAATKCRDIVDYSHDNTRKGSRDEGLSAEEEDRLSFEVENKRAVEANAGRKVGDVAGLSIGKVNATDSVLHEISSHLHQNLNILKNNHEQRNRFFSNEPRGGQADIKVTAWNKEKAVKNKDFLFSLLKNLSESLASQKNILQTTYDAILRAQFPQLYTTINI